MADPPQHAAAVVLGPEPRPGQLLQVVLTVQMGLTGTRAPYHTGVTLAFELRTPEQTRALGARLAKLLRPGDLVILDGPLGAGKTVLAQGIGAGLGVRGVPTSPTFVIARVHPPDPAQGGRIPLVHVDAFRLSSVAEVDDLDLDTSLEDSVTVVEWGRGKVEHLAEDHLQIQITPRPAFDQTETPTDSDHDVRVIRLIPHGPTWPPRLSESRDALLTGFV